MTSTTVPFEAVTMTADVAAALRAPFAPEHMGKLPKITCGKCRGSRNRPNPLKECDEHRKQKCRDCRNWITPAHMHLDYVGHAEVTDRLISVDPLWTWRPLAFDADGLPKFDQFGALWIELTVAGKPMIGYGDAGAKTGPDAVKEVIGDAIRNAAMRLGVALDLWGATFKAAEADAEAELREGSPEVPEDDWEAATPVRPVPAPAAPSAPPAQARPVDRGPVTAAYQPTYYPRGREAIEQATSFAQLDALAAQIEGFTRTGEINPAEAGRLRMKLGDARDLLGQRRDATGTPLDEPPGDLARELAANALSTATTSTGSNNR